MRNTLNQSFSTLMSVTMRLQMPVLHRCPMFHRETLLTCAQRLRSIPVFDGTVTVPWRTPAHGDATKSIIKVLYHFESVMLETDTPPSEWLYILREKFTGPASIAFAAWEQSLSVPLSRRMSMMEHRAAYSNWRSVMITQFVPPDFMHLLLRKQISLQQAAGESINSYYFAFVELEQHVPVETRMTGPVAERNRHMRFVGGLNGETKAIHARMETSRREVNISQLKAARAAGLPPPPPVDFHTVEELLEMFRAAAFQDQAASASAAAFLSGTEEGTPAFLTSGMRPVAARPSESSKRPMTPAALAQGQPSPSKRGRPDPGGDCYFCGRPGHMYVTCPDVASITDQWTVRGIVRTNVHEYINRRRAAMVPPLPPVLFRRVVPAIGQPPTPHLENARGRGRGRGQRPWRGARTPRRGHRRPSASAAMLTELEEEGEEVHPVLLTMPRRQPMPPLNDLLRISVVVTMDEDKPPILPHVVYVQKHTQALKDGLSSVWETTVEAVVDTGAVQSCIRSSVLTRLAIADFVCPTSVTVVTASHQRVKPLGTINLRIASYLPHWTGETWIEPDPHEPTPSPVTVIVLPDELLAVPCLLGLDWMTTLGVVIEGRKLYSKSLTVHAEHRAEPALSAMLIQPMWISPGVITEDIPSSDSISTTEAEELRNPLGMNAPFQCDSKPITVYD